MSFGFGFALPAYPLRGGGGNNPFNQTGPTLDLSFMGNAGNLSGADTYTLDTNFITPQYQVAAQYAVWVDGSGMTQRNFADIVTFTRGSNATQFDSTGSLVYAPANLLTWSEDFSNAAWTKQASVSVATNTSVAPDGTTTGDTVTADSGFGVYQQLTVTVGTQVTQSIYIKAGTATSLMFRDDTGAGRHIVVNPSTGAVTSTSGTLLNSGSISVGNGWYRIYFSYVADATVVRGIVRPDSAGAGQTFLVWGGQTNLFPVLGGITSSLTTYYPTTTAAYYGPRFDFNPSTLAAQGLLIEEQRTNSIRNNTMQGAVAGTPGTLPTNWVVVSSGLTQTIVGTGTSAGVNYIDIRVNGTTTSAGGVQIKPDGNAGVIAATASQAWAMSSWVAIVGGSTANTTGQRFVINEYSAGPTYLRTAVAATNVLAGGATLTRVSGAITTGASTTILEPIIILDAANGAAIDITLRIGLPQLEQGAFATSVIPTTTTALTRSADVASVNTLAPWFNSTEGTLFVDSTVPYTIPASSFPTTAAFTDGTNNNRLDVGYITSAVASMASVVGGVTTAEIYPAVSVQNRRNAFAYKTNDFAGCSNGGAVGTDTSGALPTVDRLLIGSLSTGNRINGYLRRISYFPRRLANADLQTITT